MQERGILFKDRLVRGILEDRKTQTRRLVTPPLDPEFRPLAVERYEATVTDRLGIEQPGPLRFGAYDEDRGRICPYGGPGDRLWVREAWHPCSTGGVHFRTNGPCGCFGASKTGDPRWKPGIHLRRLDARLLLDVAQVRVEPLQSMTNEEAIAEGIEVRRQPDGTPLGYVGADGVDHFFPLDAFASLWDSIHGGTRYEWARDPEVWAITFKRVFP